MRRRSALAALGASLCLGGVAVLGRRSGVPGERSGWPTFAAGLANTGWNPRADGPSRGCVDWRVLHEERWHRAPPVVAEGTVVVGAGDDPGTVYALDADSGDVRWSTRPGRDAYHGYVSRRIVGTPAIRNGTVYVGTHDWRVHALDLSDGSNEWTRSLDGTVADRPLAATDDRVFVVGNKEVVALDAIDGERRWTYEFPAQAEVYPSAPAVADGRLYVAGERRLRSLDARTGTDVGVTTVTDGKDRRIEGAPVVAGDAVVLSVDSPRLFAVDRRRGTTRWSVEPTGDRVVGRPAVAGDRVVAASAPSLCLDPVKAELGENESRDDETNATERPDEPEEGDCRTKRGVEAFDLRTGNRLWRATEAEPSASPTVADGTVYVDDADGLLALDLTDGRRQWRHTFDGEMARTAIAGERLFATTGRAVVVLE